MAISELDKALASLTRHMDRHLALPAIDRVVLPRKMLSVSEANAKHDKFGLVVLEDNNAGFFYRLLDVQPDMIDHYRQLAEQLRGRSISDCLHALESRDLFARGLALGAINAATAALFNKTGYTPPARDALGNYALERTVASTSLSDGDRPMTDSNSNSDEPHSLVEPNSNSRREDKDKKQYATNVVPAKLKKIGMIGYFSAQAKRLQAQGHQVAVLEMNKALAVHEEGLTVSHESQVLDQCQIIYCTASTLINDTLEGLLSTHATHTQFELVGPSAGCFPDPLFDRGTNLIGGSRVADIESAEICVYNGQPWQRSVDKFSLSRDDYPGSLQLLSRL